MIIDDTLEEFTDLSEFNATGKTNDDEWDIEVLPTHFGNVVWVAFCKTVPEVFDGFSA